MVGIRNNNSSVGTGIDRSVNNPPPFVTSNTMPRVFSSVFGAAATGGPGVEVSTVARGPSPRPPRPENNETPVTPPGQPTCQELLESIRLQDALLVYYSQRLSRLEAEHRHMSAQVAGSKDTNRRTQRSPPHASAQREVEQSAP
ncbi:COP1-interacting protein 7 [Sesbania bispinosa]|nr:COP1-interacting protein 7 [Sesbania bispinosa]